MEPCAQIVEDMGNQAGGKSALPRAPPAKPATAADLWERFQPTPKTMTTGALLATQSSYTITGEVKNVLKESSSVLKVSSYVWHELFDTNILVYPLQDVPRM